MHLWTCACCLVVLVSFSRSSDPVCEEPPSVQFASIQGPEAYTPGSTLTYACEFGYVASGSQRTTECVVADDGEARWTDLDLSCKPRSCGDPGYVPNSHLLGALFTFPNSVRFECEEGYRLHGNAKRYCHASGSWSGTLPRCQRVFCRPPSDPENGLVSYDSLEYGSELKFECRKGYHLEDDETVYCASDGLWSKTDVRCVEVACAMPEQPEHGSVEIVGSSDSPQEGTLAIFSCEGERIADGPTTSKCLDIGQWTFPTPACLEPCSVPEVPNGKIGRYVKGRGWTLVFREIPVGSRLEDKEKLFLHCSSGYSPLGSTVNWQERVVCSRGKWTEKPFCEPKSCQSDPPGTQNGRVKEVVAKHGGTVLYECLPGFKKIKTGNVVCLFGEWKGVTPVCRDTRCSADELVFPGLEKGRKLVYRDGEKLEIKCTHRYRLAKEPGSSMECEDGFWKGPMPPCVAVACSGSPPGTDHGRAKVTSVSHSSIVQYICDDQYILVQTDVVQCLFGEWSGRPPTCKDSRCYSRNLQFVTGVSLETTESATLSGNRLGVECSEGYTARTQLPMCHNGVWSRHAESPCKEKDCPIPWIENGDVMKHTLGSRKWNFWEFRYVRPSILTKQYSGDIPSRSDSLFLVCFDGFSVQGKGVNRVPIVCSGGRWSPNPVCLRTGTRYVPPTRKPATARTRPTTPEIKLTTIPEDLPEEQKTTVENNLTEINPVTIEEEEEEECSCEFVLKDKKVLAYSEGRELEEYDTLKRGSVLSFRCREVGLHHLVGKRELTCENCQPWHTSDYPICTAPKQGDTVIVYSGNVNVSVDGALEVRRGESLRLTCIAVEEAVYPAWSVPDDTGVEAVPERMERLDDYLYMSHLDIGNPGFEHEGPYECAVERYPATTVELRVIDPDVRCPELVFDEEALWVDAEKTRVGATVTFACRNRNHNLNGTAVLTCLRSGEWSGNPPECEEVKCRELKETDLLQVSYAGDRRVGSFAAFHCFAPGKTNGVVRTRCLDSGQWEHPAPTCKTPPCPARSLFAAVPQNVEPNMDDVYNETLPYNATVRLTCKADMVFWGNAVATCGRDGQWNVEPVQCVSRTSGCPKLTKKDVNLIINPEKDSYSFGDIVTFLCTPGYYLDVENSRTMCLNGRWTEKTLPKCLDSVNYES